MRGAMIVGRLQDTLPSRRDWSAPVIVLTLNVLNRSNDPSIDWFPHVLILFVMRLSQIFVHA